MVTTEYVLQILVITQGSHRLLPTDPQITGFKDFSRSTTILKARHPLLAVRSSHKILYCDILETYYNNAS